MGKKAAKAADWCDHSSTTIGNGRTSMPKSYTRIIAFGEIEEFNATIGLVLSIFPNEGVGAPELKVIQECLADIGYEIHEPGSSRTKLDTVTDLEAQFAEIDGALPTQEETIIPRGSELVVRLYHARTVCRRAERALVALNRERTFAGTEYVNCFSIQYLNRLSDYLLVLARIHDQ